MKWLELAQRNMNYSIIFRVAAYDFTPSPNLTPTTVNKQDIYFLNFGNDTILEQHVIMSDRYY